LKHGEVSLYVVTSDSISPQSLQKTIKMYVDCIKKTPEFRLNDSPFTLFWWDLQVQNITTFRNEIKDFQHNHPYTSVFIMDNSINRIFVKCC